MPNPYSPQESIPQASTRSHPQNRANTSLDFSLQNLRSGRSYKSRSGLARKGARKHVNSYIFSSKIKKIA
ncbi:hypothetical protein QUA56_02575 [Microcoleus sp. N3A4]